MTDAVLVAIVGAVGAVLVAWLERARRESRRATRAATGAASAANDASDAATAAAGYAKPTGNGFAQRVTSALDRIEQDNRLFRAETGQRFDGLSQDVRELRRADRDLTTRINDLHRGDPT